MFILEINFNYMKRKLQAIYTHRHVSDNQDCAMTAGFTTRPSHNRRYSIIAVNAGLCNKIPLTWKSNNPHGLSEWRAKDDVRPQDIWFVNRGLSDGVQSISGKQRCKSGVLMRDVENDSFSLTVIGGDDVIDNCCCATTSPTFRLRVIFWLWGQREPLNTFSYV